MLQQQQQHSTTTIQEKQKGEAPIIVLQRKFDSIIAKEHDSYNWLKNMLSNQILYDNASMICDYVIAMQQEANISHNTRINLVANLCKFAKFDSIINNKKTFKEATREDVLLYLQSIRTRNAKKNNNSNNNSNNTNEDNKWIGTYNFALGTLQKFYKWLYYPNVLPENRALPDSVSGFKKIKRKELTTYSANDIWTMQEHSIFLKYCPTIRMRAYHAIALDTSARPHELLKLKIKDLKERVIPAIKDRPECVIYQFLVKGKTGTRALALTNSMAYAKEWLAHHPQRANKEAFLFLSDKSGSVLNTHILHQIYTGFYQREYFPKLLEDKNVPQHDKEIIQIMLQERKWNPYIIRHSALTMKAKNRMMSDTMLRQHAGWSKESKMPSVYIHNYGSESVDEMLRIQGYLPKENSEFEFNPVDIKKCGNCGTHNLPEAISCSKCKLLIDAVAYQHILKEQEEKDNKLSAMEKQFREMQTQMRSLISAFTGMKEDQQRGNMAETLYNSGIVRKIENSNNNKNKKKVVDNNSDSNDNNDNEVN